MEEARRTEWIGAQLLARHPSEGFEQPIRRGPRRQKSLAADHEEHANRCDYCLFQYPWIGGRREVCRKAGLWVVHMRNPVAEITDHEK